MRTRVLTFTARHPLVHPRWRIAISWLMVIVWMGVIFAFSSQSSLPSAPDTLLDFLVKKAAHVTEYAILAFLVFNAVRGTAGPRNLVRSIALAIVIALGYAASDEFHQSLTPTRHPSPVDVGIDMLGILIGTSLSAAFRLHVATPPDKAQPGDSHSAP